MSKRALITGITGQDGSYLAEFLLNKGYEVYGTVRKTSHFLHPNIGHIQNNLKLIYADLLDPVSIDIAVKEANPDEVYNLASQSAPGESFKQPIHTAEITGIGAHRVLEAVRKISPGAKVYQASSSEMFGWVKEIPQNEDTPLILPIPTRQRNNMPTPSAKFIGRVITFSSAMGFCSITNPPAGVWGLSPKKLPIPQPAPNWEFAIVNLSMKPASPYLVITKSPSAISMPKGIGASRAIMLRRCG